MLRAVTRQQLIWVWRASADGVTSHPRKHLKLNLSEVAFPAFENK